jgi:PTH1 family peptidyl-tRNA hydrolase
LVHGYVLHDFSKSDQVWLEPLLDTVAKEFPLIAEGQPDKFSSRVGMAT